MSRILSKLDPKIPLPDKLKRLTPDKVVEKEGEAVLMPSTNVIGIVLRHQLTEKPTIEKLGGRTCWSIKCT